MVFFGGQGRPFYISKTMKTVKERFEEKYIPEPNTGCWLWTATTMRGGYGHFFINKKLTGAHRASWMIYNGELSLIGKNVCHRCDTPACVNPEHLFLGSQSDNVRDMHNKRRGAKKKSVCRKGHVLNEDNTSLNKNGYRRCKKCTNSTRMARYYKGLEAIIG